MEYLVDGFQILFMGETKMVLKTQFGEQGLHISDPILGLLSCYKHDQMKFRIIKMKKKEKNN